MEYCVSSNLDLQMSWPEAQKIWEERAPSSIVAIPCYNMCSFHYYSKIH